MILITKLLSDITAGKVNTEKLLSELKADIAKVQIVSEYNLNGTPFYDSEKDEEVRIYVSSSLTGAETTTLDTLVTDHVEFSLAENKVKRYKKIDIKTVELITEGFTYDSQIFSLSSNARGHWNTLKNQKASFTFPKNVSTLDSNTYSLTDANVDTLWDEGKLVVDGYLDSGRVLKKSIFDAADQDAVDAVVDSR